MRKKNTTYHILTTILIHALLLSNLPLAIAQSKVHEKSTLSPNISLSKPALKSLFNTKQPVSSGFDSIPLDKSFSIPFPFPLAKYNRGQNDPEWLKSYLLARTILTLSSEHGINIPQQNLIKNAKETFKAYGLNIKSPEIITLLNGLRKRGIIKANGDYDFTLKKNNIVFINTPLRTIAVWSDDFDFIQSDLQKAFKAGRKVFLKAIQEYASSSEQWPNYPIEALYPVLRAITQFSAKDQKKIVNTLLSNERLQNLPLVDSIILMLDSDKGKQRWLNKHAPHLLNRNVYLVAAEISLLAGGLGRVMQYHGTGMYELGAAIKFIEPKYRKNRDKNNQAHPLDFSKAPVPVKDLKKIDRKFSTIVQGEPVEFEVEIGTNSNGIPVYLIQDIEGKYVNILYEYGTDESPASNYEFTEFFTKATLELIRYLEVKELNKKGKNYNSPLVDANDGQVLPLNAWRRIFYSDRSKISSEKTTKAEINKTYTVLKNAIFNGTTHTYGNRVMLHDFNVGRDYLRKAGVPDEYLWLFLRKEIDGSLLWDFTSGGLRSSDIAKGVAAIHAFEMNTRDPLINLVGITNGDNRAYSAHFFRQALAEIGVTDFEHPTPEQVLAAKKMCKKNIGLNPNQLVISYSGRLVGEKTGRERAFTDSNIEAMVKASMQVVIYGNVQPYEGSTMIRDDLLNLEKRLNDSGYPGKFIFKPKFDIDEQRKLLAATDIQIQDSDRYTGAAEYTEADVSANGGLQMGAPFWEGIIQRQGAVINMAKKTGNTLVPASRDSQSYLDILDWANSLPLEELSIYQAQSVRLSRVHEALLTAAAYLRFWNTAFGEKTYNMAAPIPRVSGEVNISDISMNYQTEKDINNAKREGNIFKIEQTRDNLENLEIQVIINRNAYDSVNYGKQGLIPLETIKVTLVNDYGVVIPFNIKESNNTRATFNAYIPNDLPLPTKGTIEVTSGVWTVAQDFSINIDYIPVRDIQANSVLLEQSI